jgi:hypothetical protein
MKIPFLQRFYASVARHTAERLANDLQFAIQTEARDTSARFIVESMKEARPFRDQQSLLLHGVEKALPVRGCVCEFGVFEGRTLRVLADNSVERTIHGFDSFEGLPTSWRQGFDKGAFKVTPPRFTQNNIRLHIGWFEQTLSPFLHQFADKIALAHIDCDLYSSTKTVLDAIVPRLTIGSILVFDEYFNYPSWQDHEHRALLEVINAGAIEVAYIGYNSYGQQVAAQVVGGHAISKGEALKQ